MELITNNLELKNLIAQNPDLPLVILIPKDVEIKRGWKRQALYKCKRGIFLDPPAELWVPNRECVFTNEPDLYDEIVNVLMTENNDLDDEMFYQLVEEKLLELEQYWKDCIILQVGDANGGI